MRHKHSVECSRHETWLHVNVEEEMHENKDASHSGYKKCSIDLDMEWTSLIEKCMDSCKKCGDIELIEGKKDFLNLLMLTNVIGDVILLQKTSSHDVKKKKNQK